MGVARGVGIDLKKRSKVVANLVVGVDPDSRKILITGLGTAQLHEVFKLTWLLKRVGKSFLERTASWQLIYCDKCYKSAKKYRHRSY